MADAIEDRLTKIAQQPAQVSIDGQTVQQMDPDKLVRIANRAAGIDAAKTNPFFGLRYFKYRPPGAGR